MYSMYRCVFGVSLQEREREKLINKECKGQVKGETGLLGKGGVDRGERASSALTLKLSGCC